MMTPTDMPKREFGVLSRDIILNGKVLERGEDASLRSLLSMGKGKPATSENFVVRARSYGFAVDSDAAAPACM